MSKNSYLFIKLITITILLHISVATATESKATLEELAQSELKYDIATFESSTKNLIELTDYSSTQIKHKKEIFKIIESTYKTQQYLTAIISFVVLLLVIGGFVIAALQFKLDYRNKQMLENNSRFSLKINKEGMEFSSSVIGLIVLFMSFFFFHLYIKDVYTIKINTILDIQTKLDNIERKK